MKVLKSPTTTQIQNWTDVYDFVSAIAQATAYNIDIYHQDVGLSVETLYNYTVPNDATVFTQQSYGALWENASAPVDTIAVTTDEGGYISLDSQDVVATLSGKNYIFLYKSKMLIPSSVYNTMNATGIFDDPMFSDLLTNAGITIVPYTMTTTSGVSSERIILGGPSFGLASSTPSNAMIDDAYWSFQGFGYDHRGVAGGAVITGNTPALITDPTAVGNIGIFLSSLIHEGYTPRIVLRSSVDNSTIFTIGGISKFNKVTYQQNGVAKSADLTYVGPAFSDAAETKRCLAAFSDATILCTSLMTAYRMVQMQQRISSNTTGVNAAVGMCEDMGLALASLDDRVTALEQGSGSPSSDNDLDSIFTR